MKKSNATTKQQQEPQWYLFDASQYILGKLAVKIARLLTGKDFVDYNPAKRPNVHVIVINAGKIKFTGRKDTKKIYYRHTRYPGGIRQEVMGDLLERRPTEVVRRAVFGMLPKNRLQARDIKNLHIYADDKHPHTVTNINIVNA